MPRQYDGEIPEGEIRGCIGKSMLKEVFLTNIKVIMIGILFCMSGELVAKEKDSLILEKIFEYREANLSEFQSLEDNIYTKYRFNVEKRNFILWLIPTTYVLAKDPREYIREAYSKVQFKDEHNFDINSQVLSGTIRKNRRAMPTLIDYMTPNIYDIAFYEGHVLSPFNRWNRHYYHYTQIRLMNGATRLDFRPKLYNTQLLNGYAVVETETGRILRTVLNGEFDMITFRTEITQSEGEGRTLMPAKCNTAATFRFLGNRISVLFNAFYDCPTNLPDTIGYISNREMMDSIRPVPLNRLDKKIYEAYDLQQEEAAKAAAADTLPHKPNLWKKIFWDTIGENLVTPISAESGNATFRLSPIINPLYISYSGSRGFRYKMKLRTRFSFSEHRYLNIEPSVGYNFKQHKVYYDLPIQMIYNPKRNGYAELVYANGNRISNATIKEEIRKTIPDSIDLDKLNITDFNDNYLKLFNNIMVFDWLDVETGLLLHQRKAINPEAMRYFGMPDEFRSFATTLGIKLQPWLNKGPLLSIDWEHSFEGVNKSNLPYDRWEFDAQWKYPIPGLRLLNMRAGVGFFTSKDADHFLDFSNFRDENLPQGWNDDWSGNFQLLGSNEYNVSDYYIRWNLSYESPLLFGTWIPYLGKYIEKERFYISGVLLEHSRPYYEIGYGFTNRYLSVGAFASFRNFQFEKFGMKFDFELFKRW